MRKQKFRRIYAALAAALLLAGCQSAEPEEAVSESTEQAEPGSAEQAEPEETEPESVEQAEQDWSASLEVLDVCAGDIGNDGTRDYAVVVEYAEPWGVEPEKRTVFVVLTTADGERKSYRQDSLVYDRTAGGVYGDPYAGMEIKDGLLKISQYGGSAWRWGYTDTFCIRDGELVWYSYEELEQYIHTQEFTRTIYLPLDGTVQSEGYTETDGEWSEEPSQTFAPEAVPFEENILEWLSQPAQPQ